MISSSAIQVAPDLIFDPRLALFHQQQGWLAVADLHYGYELSFRSVGALFPDFGMAAIETRLASLLADYRPQTLFLLGDHIHNSASARAFLGWLETLGKMVPALTLLRGNHDKALQRAGLVLHQQVHHHGFLFQHGHEEYVAGEEYEVVTGHWHPGVVMHDSAGLRHKLPALGRRDRRWILPAFSVWAAGGPLEEHDLWEYWVSTGSKCFHKKQSAGVLS